MITKVCKNCGSEDVVKDAWASWDKVSQEWVLNDFFDDNDFCKECEGEAKIIDKPI